MNAARNFCACALACATCLSIGRAAGSAIEINDPSYFGGSANVVNFDQFADDAPFSDEVPGVLFRSESVAHAGYPDYTDPADIHNRFDDPMYASAGGGGGGSPVSGTRYAWGCVDFVSDMYNVEDMRIDFATPQQAAAMWFIDNDFSDARLRAFDSAGGLLGTTVIAEVPEGGVTYRGLAVGSPAISYLIIDGDGMPLDSTFIDDVTFTHTPPPPPPPPPPGVVTVMIGDDDGFGGTQWADSDPGDPYTNFSSPAIAPGSYRNLDAMDVATENPWTPYTFVLDFAWDTTGLANVSSAEVLIQTGSLARRSDGSGFGFAPVAGESSLGGGPIDLGELLDVDTGVSASALEESVKASVFDVAGLILPGTSGVLTLTIDGSGLSSPVDLFAFDFAQLTIVGSPIPSPSALGAGLALLAVVVGARRRR